MKWVLGGLFAGGLVVACAVVAKLDRLESVMDHGAAILERVDAKLTATEVP
jgi:hypothetical protein